VASDVRHGDRSAGAGSAGDECNFAFKRWVQSHSSFSRRVSESFQPGVRSPLPFCKAVAERAGLDPTEFDLKTFRSTYATRMLRQGFDVRTVQDWMGHKSLETTMRYLVPATDVHDRLDEIEIPGITESAVPKKAPGSERLLVARQKKMRR